MIQEIYSERFKSLGWRKQGQNFRFIQDDGLGKIINFQKSKWNTKEEVTFFINYGIYIEAKDNIDNKSFKEYDCQFRNRTSYMNGTYTLNNDSTINEAIDMTAIALKEASDFFDIIDSKDTFIKMLLNGEISNYTDIIVMDYYTCKLLFDMGFYNEIYGFVKNKSGKYFNELAKKIEQKKKENKDFISDSGSV